jgi:hypothetical protein
VKKINEGLSFMNLRKLVLAILFCVSIPAFAEDVSVSGWKRCTDQVNPDHYDYYVSSVKDELSGKMVDQVSIFTKSMEPSLADHLIFYPETYDPTPIAGQTIRFSADVLVDQLGDGLKADGTPVTAGVGLWMEASRHFFPEEGDPKRSCYLFLDSTKNRRITQTGISHIEIVAHIPGTVEEFAIGTSLYGNGKALFFNLKMDIVDPSTPELTGTSPTLTPNAYTWCPTN